MMNPENNRYGHADTAVAMEIAHLMETLLPDDPNRQSLLSKLMAKLRPAEQHTVETQTNGCAPQTARYEV